MEQHKRSPPKELSAQELRQFFISHLNRIYCAKSQLVDKLPELGKRSNFLDLCQAIDETVAVVKLQISRMRQIYIALDETYRPESCIGLIGVLDEAFQSIGAPGESAALCDLSILFYMQNIESIEMASFKVMELVAAKLERPEIAQLLLECYDEAREDKILFKEITSKYV
jgi:ferritin-like metal-binding protein YciE